MAMEPTFEQQVAALHRHAQQALERRAYKEAHQLCARILSLEPGHADAHFLMGMIALGQMQIGKALALIDRAVARVPDNPEYLARRAQCLALLKRDTEALDAAERALALDPQDALTMGRAGAHEKGVEALQRAIALRPSEAQYHFNLAASQLFLGHFAEAEASYEAAVAAKPDFFRAHWALSDLVKATPERNHIDRLKRLLESNPGTDEALYLCHALAKEHEDLGEDAAALEYLIQGNSRKREALGYSIERDRSLFEAVEKAFDASSMEQAGEGWASEEPIFVVGMPRTGTTLVERILSSHSTVFSAGELQAFGLALKRATRSMSNEMFDKETVEKGLKVNFSELGQRYIASTRPATGQMARFVDKMPMNFFYIGFIHLALPNAKIVCLRRQPMDACLANFRQLFRLNHSYYNYAYDLSDIAEYYVLFDHLMGHWEALLPGRVLQIAYEDIVADQEAQTRRLLEFCDLDWEDACLDFHLNKSPIATASAVQARQPIYSGSIGRWKRYGGRLESMRKQLEAGGIEIE